MFLDRVITGPTTEAVFHLGVYSNGMISVSRALFPLDHDGAASATSDQVDFKFVGAEKVTQLRQALLVAGAPRLHGVLKGSGLLAGFVRDTQVTYFGPNRTLRPHPFIANSFSFGHDVLNPAALRVEAVLDAFALAHFPELFRFGPLTEDSVSSGFHFTAVALTGAR